MTIVFLFKILIFKIVKFFQYFNDVSSLIIKSRNAFSKKIIEYFDLSHKLFDYRRFTSRRRLKIENIKVFLLFLFFFFFFFFLWMNFNFLTKICSFYFMSERAHSISMMSRLKLWERWVILWVLLRNDEQSSILRKVVFQDYFFISIDIL